jgi:ABC-type transport system involved in multi-copper enzyme maturation permease subunit
MLSHFIISRVWAITLFELTRLFGSKRGLIVLSTFSLIWFLVLYYIIGSATDFIYTNTFKNLTYQIFGELDLLTLLEWQLPELTIYWLISAYILPFFTLIFTCDQTCSDRERGTLRFILLRSSRAELLYGRFLGQLLIISILVSITLIASLVFASFAHQEISFNSMSLALIILLKLIVITLPFIASMSLINVFVSSAKMSLVVYALLYIGIVILINLFSGLVFDVSFLLYIIPGEQIKSVVGFEDNVLNTYGIPIIQSLAYLLLAQFAFKRSSL